RRDGARSGYPDSGGFVPRQAGADAGFRGAGAATSWSAPCLHGRPYPFLTQRTARFMSTADFDMAQGTIRGTDSNSLLRLYDRARDVARSSTSQQERLRADKAQHRIARELERRKVSL